MYFPYVLNNFQGYKTKDLKESRKNRHIRIILEHKEESAHLCGRCGDELGRIHSTYFKEAKHLKICSFSSSVVIPVVKAHCKTCKKIRSELVTFLCPTSPHVTMELSWWLFRITGMSSVLQTSKLESVDKNTCYAIDKHILKTLLQGYKIPKVTHISVDEVYARSSKQKEPGETRDDLFLTVIIDLRTRKAIWVSKSRRKEALDEFFEVLGEEACRQIEVVATDQHDGYGKSVREHCSKAKLVWDKFHLIQSFNEALNEERKLEFERARGEKKEYMKWVRGRYRFLFIMRDSKRKKKEREHLVEALTNNKKLLSVELIKERLHRMYECMNKTEALEELSTLYEWSLKAGAEYLSKWFWNLLGKEEFGNYFDHPFTTSVSEGINRVIKGLKWQAYGYKDMDYFKLKILQKCGYLNYKYALNDFNYLD